MPKSLDSIVRMYLFYTAVHTKRSLDTVSIVFLSSIGFEVQENPRGGRGVE